jgi:2-polyprenyl-6-methoxyphenol hydroxylase-like FAD-dependent oxidoreductase
MSDVHDVVVAGGGPGGCAAALALRAHAPGLSVALVEATDYAEPRIGETLPPAAASLLRHLGVWDAFAAQGHRPAYGTAAAWGDADPHENDFFFQTQSVGWHLERAAFDAMLSAEAEARGAAVQRSTRVTGAARDGDGWRLRLSSGGGMWTRFVVDATGSGAQFARRHGGAGNRVHDRLAGFCRFFRERAAVDPRTLVEAFADGWWYTAALPGGLRIAACMTDTDLARGMALEADDAWFALLRETAPRVSALLDGAEPVGEPVVRAARSRRLEPAAGEGWIAVGDAASTFDPLSSQGILKALRSGIYAAYAAGDLLAKSDRAGMQRYRAFIEREFEAYLRTRGQYYAEERRWPEHEFWRRRHAHAAEPAAV